MRVRFNAAISDHNEIRERAARIDSDEQHGSASDVDDGAAGGGGVAVASGAVGQVSAGLGFEGAGGLGVHASLGKIRSLQGGFSADVIGLSVSYRTTLLTGARSGDHRAVRVAGTLLCLLALAAVVGVAAVLACATYARFYLMMSVGERIIADLRRSVFAHVLTLTPAYFDAARTGEISSRLTNDTEQIRQVIGFGLSMFLRNLLMMAGALAMLFATSAKLAALIVLGVPATLIPILVVGRRVRRLSRDNQDRVADVSAHIDESLHEVRTVQAYGHEAHTRARFDQAAGAAYASGLHRIRVKAWLIALVMLIGFCAVGGILWIGGHDVFAGRITAGQLSAFVFYAAVVASGAGTVRSTASENGAVPLKAPAAAPWRSPARPAPPTAVPPRPAPA